MEYGIPLLCTTFYQQILQHNINGNDIQLSTSIMDYAEFTVNNQTSEMGGNVT